MRIKLALHRAGAQTQDLLVTADAATTVGDVARHLKLADPAPGAALDPQQEWTLSVSKESQRLLDPRTPLGDSPIRSGALVAVLPAGRQFSVADRQTVAVATVVAGPGTGREYPLASGTSIVGRNRTCEVRLDDVLVSRQHARLNVTDHIEIIDLGSANGIEMNGSVVSREVVRPTDVVQIGDTALTFRMTQVISAEGRTDSASVGFIRSPRLAPQYQGREFEPPEVPQRAQIQYFPYMMLMLPILMAGILYVATRQWQSVIFAALSPLMMIGMWWETRRQGKSADKKAIAAFRQDLAALIEDVTAEAKREESVRRGEHPSTADCVDAVHRRRPLMWTRRPDDWGFLEMRLGLGSLSSRSTIKPLQEKNAPRDLVLEAREALAPLGIVHDVPVVASPMTAGGIGVAGPRSAALAATRALVLQAVCLHSPAELAVALLASARGGQDWEWLKWLPHVDAPGSPVEARHLAGAPADATALTAALESLVESRSSDDKAIPVPAVLVIVESEAPVDFGRLVELSEKGWAHGIHLLWVAPETEQLPAACRTFVDVTSLAESGVGYVHEATMVRPVTTETATAETAQALARSMSPVIDLGARNEDASDLPRSIAFLAMDGYEALGDQAEAVVERWRQNHSILTGPRACEPARREASLRAAVGHSAGHLHYLDLRTDGPHALVGGTTGAGKSELLQAWILSMAANHSPQRLTFLLVDYKGGSAFADCNRLPHTVGMVTNLDANGVQRALASLKAELDYRMEVLQQAKAKDLMALEKRWVTDAPPSLVIVVDEFAALVQEVPEFVDGVVNVAQRGRSLGLHLILATQRPAGVIKDNLRANTNLRLALRVADEGDSTDVLGSTDAAFFDPELPGRAVSKTGPGRLVPFQTAYAGGQTGGAAPLPDIRVEELGLGVGRRWDVPEAYLPPAIPADAPTDIKRVVNSICAANDLSLLPAPRKPWLPDLGTAYNIVSLVSSSGTLTSSHLIFGMLDDPANQAQRPVFFDPDKSGNLAVFGASGSGKSTMLRTVAVSAGLGFRQDPCWVYGLDFGAQGLAMLSALPHVGDIIRGSDDERVRRLLRWLAGVLDERSIRYAAANADTITEYRKVTGRSDEPRVLVLLDHVGGFLKAYEINDEWIDRVVAIATAGRAVGVHLVVTADRSAAIPTQLGATIQQRLVMRMTTVEEYDNLAAPRFMLNPESAAGRAIWSGFETQVAVLAGATDLGTQSREMKALAAAIRAAGVPVAPGVPRLVDDVALAALPPKVGDEVTIGVSDATMGPLGIVPEGTFVVAGPPGSGRTTGLLTVATAVQRADDQRPSYLLTLDRRSPLLRADLWTHAVLGLEESAELARELTSRLESEPDFNPLVVIEKISEWANSSAEYDVEALLRAVPRAGGFVLSDAEASAAGRYGLGQAVNASRTGFLLQPDSTDADSFGAQLPRRLSRAHFPPGRGFYVRGGVASLGHLARV